MSTFRPQTISLRQRRVGFAIAAISGAIAVVAFVLAATIATPATDSGYIGTALFFGLFAIIGLVIAGGNIGSSDTPAE